MNFATVALTKRQALDVAALSHAAGGMENPASLREIHIKFGEDHVQFGATNSLVVAVRRGTYGEFAGPDVVTGEGIYSYPARKLAQILRIAVQDKIRTTTNLAFGDGYLAVNGENVGTAGFQDLTTPSGVVVDRMGDLVNAYFEHRYHEDESTMVPLPAFQMKLLVKLAASAGPNGAIASFRQDVERHGRWYFITPFKDSWKFVGVIMETRI